MNVELFWEKPHLSKKILVNTRRQGRGIFQVTSIDLNCISCISCISHKLLTQFVINPSIDNYTARYDHFLSNLFLNI